MLRPRPNWINPFFLKAILFCIIFLCLSISPAHSEEPKVVGDPVDTESQTSTLAYLTGVAGIMISLAVGYRLRRGYDTRKDGIAG